MPKVGEKYMIDPAQGFSGTIYTLVRNNIGLIALTTHPESINTEDRSTWMGFCSTKKGCSITEEELAMVCGGMGKYRKNFIKIEDGYYCEQKRRKCQK